MKFKILASIAFWLALQQFGLSQPYKHLPDSNVVWSIHWTFPGEWSDYYFTTDDLQPDTTINAMIYTKVFQHYGNIIYYGAYRSNDSGAVYIVPPDSIQEYKIYDFSVNEGDTLKGVLYYNGIDSYWIADLLIDSTSTIPVGNEFRKIIFLHSFNPAGYPISWIEGIGGPGGFVQIPTYDYLFNMHTLTCMSVNDTLLWPYYVAGTIGMCDTNVITGIDLEINGIKVYPNPTADKVNIELGSNYCSSLDVLLFDIAGRVIIEQNFLPGSELVFDISAVKPGYYYLSLEIDKVFKQIKIIKI